MILLGLENNGTQEVLVDGLVNLGSVYRRYVRNNCCSQTFTFNGTSFNLGLRGMYHITLTAIVSAPVAGDVSIQMLENGVEIPSAIATTTITTADTEFRTITIDRIVLVDNTYILGQPTTLSKAIAFKNVGVESTITNVVVNVEKVL